jgi:hypothetical protein
MAILSAILLCLFCVYWWRASHGYSDTFTLGRGSDTVTEFSTLKNPFSGAGQINVKVSNHGSLVVGDKIIPYRFRDELGYFLILPCLWIAIVVRGWLPRPPGRERPGVPKRDS